MNQIRRVQGCLSSHKPIATSVPDYLNWCMNMDIVINHTLNIINVQFLKKVYHIDQDKDFITVLFCLILTTAFVCCGMSVLRNFITGYPFTTIAMEWDISYSTGSQMYEQLGSMHLRKELGTRNHRTWGYDKLHLKSVKTEWEIFWLSSSAWLEQPSRRYQIDSYIWAG